MSVTINHTMSVPGRLLRLAAALALTAAQTPVFANVVGSDFQNFNPTSNGLDFVTVQSSETLDPGILNLGLFFNYAVNALPEYDVTGELIRSRSAKHRNALTGVDVSVGLGLLSNWDIGVSVPSVLGQDVEAKNTRFQYKARGANEVRFNTKLHLLGDASQGVAIVADVSQNLIKNNAITGAEPGPTYTAEIAGDTTFAGRVAAGLNVGYRWRSPGKAIDDVPITPFHNQAIASAALSYLVRPVRTKLIWEVYGSKPSNADPSAVKSLQDTSETLVGVKHQATQHLDLNAGAGTFINKTAASPDYRLYAGLNYTVGPLWGDSKDRVVKRQKQKTAVKKRDQPEVVVTETVETFVIPNIHFQYDSDRVVLAGATMALEQVAEALRTNPSYRLISVQGHTDSIASDEYNQDLSQRRAETIRKYMIVKLRIPGDKIEAMGFGESVPVASNDNYQGRQLNRRVEVKIFRGD